MSDNQRYYDLFLRHQDSANRATGYTSGVDAVVAAVQAEHEQNRCDHTVRRAGVETRCLLRQGHAAFHQYSAGGDQ